MPIKGGWRVRAVVHVSATFLVSLRPGVEFLTGCMAFYCNLCHEFAGDAACAEEHFKSSRHHDEYKVGCSVTLAGFSSSSRRSSWRTTRCTRSASRWRRRRSSRWARPAAASAGSCPCPRWASRTACRAPFRRWPPSSWASSRSCRWARSSPSSWPAPRRSPAASRTVASCWTCRAAPTPRPTSTSSRVSAQLASPRPASNHDADEQGPSSRSSRSTGPTWTRRRPARGGSRRRAPKTRANVHAVAVLLLCEARGLAYAAKKPADDKQGRAEKPSRFSPDAPPTHRKSQQRLPADSRTPYVYKTTYFTMKR